MEREPGIGRQAVEPDDDRHDDSWVAALPPCPGIPSTDEEIAQADARAREQIAAGRGIPHADVARWAATLGTADETPMPREWLA